MTTFASDATRLDWLELNYPNADPVVWSAALNQVKQAYDAGQSIEAFGQIPPSQIIPVNPVIGNPNIVQVDVVVEIPWPNDPSKKWTTKRTVDIPLDQPIDDLRAYIEGTVITEFDNLRPFDQFGLAPLPPGLGEEPDINIIILGATRS